MSVDMDIRPVTVERNEKVEPRLASKRLHVELHVIPVGCCLRQGFASAMNDFCFLIKFQAHFQTIKDVLVLPRAKSAVVGRAIPIVGND